MQFEKNCDATLRLVHVNGANNGQPCLAGAGPLALGQSRCAAVNRFANSNCQSGFLNSQYGPGTTNFVGRFSLLGWTPLASGPSANPSETILPTVATEVGKVGTAFLLKLGGASSQSLQAFSAATLIPTLYGTALDAQAKYACRDVTGVDPQGW
jgi:hypothetical protein